MTAAMPDSGCDPIPVCVITGFLGSGKTTLLSKLLRHPAASRTAVVVNEFGEIGLDHDLIRSSDETLVELNSGCLCCTIRGDLVHTMRDLFIRRSKGEIADFERIVIETTGLADPAPILHTLIADRMLEHYFRLDGVIAVVDAVNGASTLDLQPEAVKQAAVADRIVVSKTDLAAAGAIASLCSRLQTLNPAAPIVQAVHGEIDPSAILDAGLFEPARKRPDVERWLREEAYRLDGATHRHHRHDHAHRQEHHHDVNRHDDRIHAFCIRRKDPIGGAALSFFLTLLIGQRGEDLLRVKGILNVAETPETPMVIHGVQHLFHPPVRLDAWPTEDRDTRLVFITRDIPKAQIERLVDALVQPASPDQVAAALPPVGPRDFSH